MVFVHSKLHNPLAAYQEQWTTADVYSSGWHWLGWHLWWLRPQWGRIIVIENVSLIEFDESDTVALDRLCNKL